MKKMLSVLVIIALMISVFPVALSEELETVEEIVVVDETKEMVEVEETEENVEEEIVEEEKTEEPAEEMATEAEETEESAEEMATEAEETKEVENEEVVEEETEKTAEESFENTPEKEGNKEEKEEILLVNDEKAEEEKIFEGEVEIVIFNENEIEKIGDEVILQAVVKGIECDYKIQWQRYELEEDEYVWNPIPGETDEFFRYVLTEENINDLLRVEITIVE